MARVKKYNSEENVHARAAKYLRQKYPGVLFRTDFAAGIKMTQGQAVKHKSLQAGRAWPDLFIAAPAYRDKQIFHGLFIELKKDGTQLKRTKDAAKILKGDTHLRVAGDWYNKHFEEQAQVLQALAARGYAVSFAVGFDEFKRIVDDHMRDAVTSTVDIKFSSEVCDLDDDEVF